MTNITRFPGHSVPGSTGYTPLAGPVTRTPFKLAIAALKDNELEGLRSAGVMLSQGKMIAEDLASHLDVHHVEEVTKEHIKALVVMWRHEGYSPSTIRKRLIIFRLLGCDTEGVKNPQKTPPKWWLNEDNKNRLVPWLRQPVPDGTALAETRPELADHIEWTCCTGLRVEESLRQKWGDVSFNRSEVGPPSPRGMSLLVDGTKTSGSRATLPLGQEAGALLIKRYLAAGCPAGSERIFPQPYRNLQQLWIRCRAFLGFEGQSTCTLKALRRSAARYLHVDRNMPLDVTRQYLRHGSVKTTMEYLRLAGGYNTEEMRRWL